MNQVENEIRKFPPLIDDSPTATKHTIIKQRLAKVASTVPRGTKLPSVRELSKLFQATSHPVQKAINALVSEGILRSKSRSGIFVESTPCKDKESVYDIDSSQVREIRLQVHTPLRNQQQFWEKAVAGFEREHRFIRISSDSEYTNTTGVSGDIVEVSFSHYPDIKEHLMDLSDYFKNRIKPISRCLIPIYLLTPKIIFNTDILDKLGLKVPSFKSFDDQINFCRTILRNEKSKNICKRITNNLQIAIWLGTYRNDIVHLVRSNRKDSSLISDLNHNLDRFINAYRSLEDGLPLRAEPGTDALAPFSSGKAAVHIGWSYQIEQLRERKVDFSFLASPFYSCDNTIFGMPFTLAISKNTRYPVECVRFINYLVSPECQQTMVEMVGNPLATQKKPGSLTHKRQLQQISGSGIIQDEYEDIHEIYLRYSVINDELWRAVDVGYGGKEALKNMINLGRAYIDIKNREREKTMMNCK